MEFIPLENEQIVEKIAETKGSNIIFKHNTTCPISRSVKQKLEQDREYLPENTPFYILDLLKYRDVSNYITEAFDVVHESPQLLLIKDGTCIYNSSLYSISAEETSKALQNAEV